MAQAFITGAGMVSALGLDLGTSVAAARAGIRRARPLDAFVLASQDTGADAPAIGHPIDLLSRGFVGRARLLRLLVAAVEDLIRRVGPLEVARASRLYLSLPDSGRTWLDLDLIRDDDARKARELERRSMEFEPLQKDAEWVWGKATSVLKWPSPPPLSSVSTGHTGFTALMGVALRELAGGGASSVIVAGVDSLLDLETLIWLHNTGRLKYADMPVGIEPGEAAACILLESNPPQDRPSCLAAAATVVDPGKETASEPLVEAIEAAQAAARTRLPQWLLLDNDGTEARAAEWGRALVHFNMVANGYDPRVAYPAISFGDTGAAFGGVSTCMAIGAWERRCGGDDLAMIVTADRPSRRAAHVLITR